MAKTSRTKANPDELRKIKSYGRQSKNIIDARDKPVGPKKNLVRTKTYKLENARGDNAFKNFKNGTLTEKASMEKNPSDTVTKLVNMTTNARRLGTSSGKLGLDVKNRKLDKPTVFVKTKKKS